MKLKILLFVVFAAGVGASYALAADGKHKDNGCQNVHLHGTVAPQSLTVTLDKAGEHGSFAAGTQVTLALGGTGQTVRVNVEACSTGTGTVLTARSIELRVAKAAPTPGTDATTTGQHHGDDEHGDHHKGATTPAPTTTAATTTVATTTGATTTSP